MRKPLRTLSKFTSEFLQVYFSGKRRHSVLFGTRLAGKLFPSLSTHDWNFPENSWTPRILNINQNSRDTTRTFPMPGMAANNALMTTWVWKNDVNELKNWSEKHFSPKFRVIITVVYLVWSPLHRSLHLLPIHATLYKTFSLFLEIFFLSGIHCVHKCPRIAIWELIV